MSRLEQRHRTLLRVLPRWYRAEREQELLAVFMADRTDDLDLEYGWPGWPETWSVLLLAVRTRLSGPPRAEAAGAVLRALALIGLLSLVFDGGIYAAQLATITPFGDGTMTVTGLMAIASAATLASVITRHLVQAKVLGIVLTLASLASVVRALGISDAAAANSLVWNLPVWVTVASLFAGFQRRSPRLSSRWWLAMAGAAVGGALWWLPQPLIWSSNPLWDMGILPHGLLVVAAVVLMVRGGAAPRLAVAISLGLALLARLELGSVVGFQPVLVVEVAAIAVSAVGLCWLGMRQLRQLQTSTALNASTVS